MLLIFNKTIMFLNELSIQNIMEVNRDLVENIAKVSRLKLSEEELNSIEKDMKNVLEAFENIQEIDTETIKMSIQPVKLNNHLRKDEVSECFTQEEALSQTKNKKDGYIMGPRSI